MTPLNPTLLKRYLQFCLVGFSGMAVDMGFLFLLSSPRTLAWDLTLSKIIAAEFAIMNNFLWNDLWTFRAATQEPKTARSRISRLVNFNLICLAGIGFSVALLDIQVYWLHVNPYVANFLAIVIVSLWNFVMSMKFGWGRSDKQRATP